MKTFLRRTGAVIISTIMLFLIINVVYYKVSNRSRLVAFEVYDAVERSSQATEYTSLVLGDSVARQLFNPAIQDEEDEICYLATNQAIMAAGNYILLENFLQNNPQLDTVYYIARPDSLQGGINFIYTYSYFITPLYREPFLKYLDQDTQAGLEKVFGSFATKREFSKWMLARYPKLLECYHDGLEKIWMIRNRIHAQKMPDMSMTYIAKMRQTCEQHAVDFALLSSPLPADFKTESVTGFQDKLRTAGMGDLAERFADSIVYLDQEEFVDGIHMTGDFLDENREKFVDDLIMHGKDEK